MPATIANLPLEASRNIGEDGGVMAVGDDPRKRQVTLIREYRKQLNTLRHLRRVFEGSNPEETSSKKTQVHTTDSMTRIKRA
jgi:hypothetical protein